MLIYFSGHISFFEPRVLAHEFISTKIKIIIRRRRIPQFLLFPFYFLLAFLSAIRHTHLDIHYSLFNIPSVIPSAVEESIKTSSRSGSTILHFNF